MSRLDAIRDAVLDRLRLSEVVGGRVEWDRRRSRPASGDWWAPCPFHQERTASFHVADAKGFYYCFGCQAKGDLIGFVREIDGLGYVDALRRLADMAGVEMTDAPPGPARGRAERDAAFQAGQRARGLGARAADNPHPPGDSLRSCWREGWFRCDRAASEAEAARSIRAGLARAAEIWRAARPDVPVLRRYLEARGVDMAVLARIWRDGVPPTIRCHPSLPYMVEEADARGRPVWREAHRGPAMIGLIAAPDFRLGAHSGVAGVHRTWITAHGRARVEGVGKLAKRMLGATGHIEPVPIRITAHSDRMIVGEGIETVLALWSRLAGEWLAGSRGFWAAEVAKSRGAIAGADEVASRGPERNARGQLLTGTEPDWTRPGWQAPDYVDELVILAEGSQAHPQEARRSYLRAERRHRRRRDGSPRRCTLSLPGGRWDADVDFADLAAGERA